jgi:hypothetical protein
MLVIVNTDFTICVVLIVRVVLTVFVVNIMVILVPPFTGRVVCFVTVGVMVFSGVFLMIAVDCDSVETIRVAR